MLLFFSTICIAYFPETLVKKELQVRPNIVQKLSSNREIRENKSDEPDDSNTKSADI